VGLRRGPSNEPPPRSTGFVLRSGAALRMPPPTRTGSVLRGPVELIAGSRMGGRKYRIDKRSRVSPNSAPDDESSAGLLVRHATSLRSGNGIQRIETIPEGRADLSTGLPTSRSHCTLRRGINCLRDSS
jgi:hypothetical protein